MTVPLNVLTASTRVRLSTLSQTYWHIKSNYRECIIAFEGYFAVPSTKDHEHQRKKKGNKGCAKISIDVNPQVYESQYLSLSNDHK